MRFDKRDAAAEGDKRQGGADRTVDIKPPQSESQLIFSFDELIYGGSLSGRKTLLMMLLTLLDVLQRKLGWVKFDFSPRSQISVGKNRGEAFLKIKN